MSAGASLADFLSCGVDDLEAALRDLTIPDQDREHWQAELEVYRDTARRLFRCCEKLGEKLTGQRVHSATERIAERYAGQRWDDIDFYAPVTAAQRDAAFSAFEQHLGIADTRLETSLAESAAEAEQRRFTERER